MLHETRTDGHYMPRVQLEVFVGEKVIIKSEQYWASDNVLLFKETKKVTESMTDETDRRG